MTDPLIGHMDRTELAAYKKAVAARDKAGANYDLAQAEVRRIRDTVRKRLSRKLAKEGGK